MLDFIEIQHYVGLAMEIAFEPIECDSHYVAMMQLAATL